MIRKLRCKFIFINLLLVGAVLAAVFVILISSNARGLREQSTASMRMALDRQDGDSLPLFEIGARPPPPHDGGRDNGSNRFAIIPVFTVTVDADGALTSVQIDDNITVSEDVPEEAAAQALASGSNAGVLHKLGLRFLLEPDKDGGARIAFADLSWEQENQTRLVLTSLLVWGLAMVGLFFISLLLSSLALRPAERAWAQQRQFVADASHELKTPLTVILANMGIVLSHPEDRVAQQSKWLGYTQEEAGRMKALVEDLLFLAKSDAARLPSRPVPAPISDLAMSCLLPFEPVAFEAGVVLHGEITPDLSIKGDEGQLRRLILILLDNAVKYAGEGGSVNLTLSRHQDKVRMTVHNTGNPIPPEHLSHLFERFYRADPSRERTQGGYGLGLAIAKSIVDAHRGKITVASTAQAGTTFTVLLPQK